MDFWSRLRGVRDSWDVLRHPFYARWSRGELTGAELAHYAGQYRHAVVALAAASERAARAADGAAERGTLAAHAAEEAAHVALWDDFARAAGAGEAAPEAETADCATAWAGAGRDLAGHLVALYAIESAQPGISRTKAQGLRDFYGFEGGAGTAYFDLHAVRDEEHAADARALLEPRLRPADEDRLLAEAERVLAANWRLLDGVERTCAASTHG